MIINIYAIYDSKAAAFLQPFFATCHAVAFRNVERACRNPDSPFVQFPEDFTLFLVGSFDDEAGALKPHSKAPESLGNFLQFLPPPGPQTREMFPATAGTSDTVSA